MKYSIAVLILALCLFSCSQEAVERSIRPLGLEENIKVFTLYGRAQFHRFIDEEQGYIIYYEGRYMQVVPIIKGEK